MIKKDYLDNFNIEIFGAEKISRGYYISSKTRITYNAKSLMERSLYLSSGNRSGKYCHKCGKESETTIEEPLCEDCKRLTASHHSRCFDYYCNCRNN